jgi:hypothetical protein
VSKELFCEKCNKQLQSIDEIENGLCFSCRANLSEVSSDAEFSCWACKKSLSTKKEIAQGVCDNCKAYIIRKLR